jgi:hypothetical protein
MADERKYRQPTIDEAVENLLRPLNSPAFQKASIQYWRERYGDEYADTVRRLALQKIKSGGRR